MRLELAGKLVEVNYTDERGHHIVDLNPWPFNAIKAQTKKIEVRTNTAEADFDFFKIRPGDTVQFVNNESGEIISVIVQRVTNYSTIKELLEIEGTQFVLSSGENIEQGITSISKLTGYKENIPKYGVLAIEIMLLVPHS